MKKRLLTSILILSMLFVTVVGGLTVSASEYSLSNDNISPRFTNCDICDFTFNVLDPGDAHVAVTYSAKADVFVQAKLTVKIQKKFLGLFWKDVDIGLTDNEWVEYSYDIHGQFYNYFPADGTGLYRAVIRLEMHGTTGVSDVIEDTIEFRYN